MRRASCYSTRRCLFLPWVVAGFLGGWLNPGHELSAIAQDTHVPAGKKSRKLFDGKTLDGWKIPGNFDFKDHGLVEVKQGLLMIGAGDPATGAVYTKPVPENNYEVTVEAKRVAGSDFFCGLTFPVDESHCTLIVGGWGGGVIGLSNIDDASAVENETTAYQDFKNDRWYQVRLRVTPNKIAVWIDDKRVIVVNPKGRKFSVWWEQEPMRPFGIATWHTGSAVRKVEVATLAAD